MRTSTSTTTKTWDNVLRSMRDNEVIPNTLNRVLLYGPPRTGKSTTAAQIFDARRITLTRTQLIDDLIGSIDPRSVGRGAQEAAWMDGPVVKAMREGTAIVFDEIDQGCINGDVRFHLHSILDEDGAVTLPTGERVKARKGFCVVGTTNEMPSKLPAPVLDRFDLILHCDTLSHDLRSRLGNLADAAQASVQRSQQWTRPASPNLLLSAAKLRDSGMSAQNIAEILYPDDTMAQADLVTLFATAGR